MTEFGKKIGSLAQGDNRTGEKGTDSLFVLTHQEIRDIPTDRFVTYGRLLVDYLPQKEDPNRVRLTTGGHLITHPGDVTTHTADLKTSKPVEERTQNGPSKVYVRQYQKLLPLRTNGKV